MQKDIKLGAVMLLCIFAGLTACAQDFDERSAKTIFDEHRMNFEYAANFMMNHSDVDRFNLKEGGLEEQCQAEQDLTDCLKNLLALKKAGVREIVAFRKYAPMQEVISIRFICASFGLSLGGKLMTIEYVVDASVLPFYESKGSVLNILPPYWFSVLIDETR
ncbi:hypothetical protein [Hydrocarboniphaga sp.]|uniref:hypothetical protein n=1 Tax=Hydrocarboniphaga sp. TaxID=2033016 RepID=UPI003D101200